MVMVRFASTGALVFVILSGATLLSSAEPTPGQPLPDLVEFVKKADGGYQWKLESKRKGSADEIITIDLRSQIWHDIPWEHKLQIYVPEGVQPQKTMLLWNTGDGPRPTDPLLGMTLAKMIKAPVAVLFGVPKQPLFDGKREDALIAETYVRFLKTQDSSWPLLFPMVKSVVKAMDAVQEYTKKEWPTAVEKFVIGGASKRGWTTWLTAATGDERVKAIIPAVIDTLNMPKQLPHQLEMFGGKYSEQIKDYTERELAPMPDTPAARKLVAMVDPWFYRSRLTMPKLILNGTNDPYWTVDALNFYWDDLPGPKWVVYVPNAGHNLAQRLPDGKMDRNMMLNTIAAFVRHQITDQPMPKLSWTFSEKDGEKTTNLKCEPWPQKVEFWKAENPTTDFRQAVWLGGGSVATEKSGPNHEVGQTMALRDKDYTAFFMQCEYEIDGIKYPLCTQLQVQPPKGK